MFYQKTCFNSDYTQNENFLQFCFNEKKIIFAEI